MQYRSAAAKTHPLLLLQLLLLAYISICVDAFTGTSQARGVSLSRTVGPKWKSTHIIRSSSSSSSDSVSDSSSDSDNDSYAKGAQERAAERKKTKQVHGGGIRPMWGKNLHGSAYAFLNAQELLTFTERTLQNSPVGQMTPQELHDAARLLPSWSKRQLPESGEVSERLLQRLIAEQKAGNPRVRLYINMFNSVINAWAKCGRPEGPRRASQILEQMEQLYQSKPDENVFPRPCTKCYVSAIDGWCRNSNLEGAPKEAETLLEKLGTLPNQTRSTKHFNALINTYANQRGAKNAERAERVMSRMTELYDAGEKNVRPNRITYNTLIKAWAHSGKRGAAKNAARIFRLMEQEAFETDNTDVEPDGISFSLLLLALARDREKHGTAIIAEEMLDRMQRLYDEGTSEVRPDIVTYNSCLNVYASSGDRDAADKCEKLLARMEDMYGQGHLDIKPDVVSYNTVLNALAQCSDPSAVWRAQNLLDKMETLYNEHGDDSVKPDRVSYNSCMHAFARSKELAAAQKAEEILNRMEQAGIRSDRYSYNIVISGWANSGDIFAAGKADALLKRMQELYADGDDTVKPDALTYNSVISAWSRTREVGAPQKAEELLNEMFALCKAGDKEACPDAYSFTTVIHAWSRSKEPDKARQAQALLRRMEDMADGEHNKSVRPNVYVYASVLNACAHTFAREERSEALNIAIETFSELHKSKHVKANHVTYGTFLRAIGHLMPDRDERKAPFIKHAFHQCCKDGQVGDTVLSQLYFTAKPGLYAELLGPHRRDGTLTTRDIPKEWAQNVREKQSHRVSSSSSRLYQQHGARRRR